MWKMTSFLIASLCIQGSASWFDLLDITPSEESIDYVEKKQQFQLHTLLTEQRHPKTWNLSSVLQESTLQGLEALFSVDEDISDSCRSRYSISLFTSVAEQVTLALQEGKKIYLYGCGATGRLAKQVESCFWKPFWTNLQKTHYFEKIRQHLPDIEKRLIGEMTGADRALISSLEGFEDLPLLGQLQLQDHNIEKGDVIFAVTEGGETSSVIGSLLGALDLYGQDGTLAKDRLFFVYNNPDEVLLPFDRSRCIIQNPLITKIPLYTGPQSITGSTRMQATTSETFILGMIIEKSLYDLLKNYLNPSELLQLGLTEETIEQKIDRFTLLQKAAASTAQGLAQLTDLEASTYIKHRFSTYFANQAIIPVFIDATERAPTFKLEPLDTVSSSERKSWIHVRMPRADSCDAWHQFLGRSFMGLDKKRYEPFFLKSIADPYLQKAALSSLQKAGHDQQYLYDFSLSSQDIDTLTEEDIAVLILSRQDLYDIDSCKHWISLFAKAKSSMGIIIETCDPYLLKDLQTLAPHAVVVSFSVPYMHDPLRILSQVTLKMILNAHSTAVMTKLGRVTKNTMTYVRPSNLKLIGRATYLIQSHVNALIPEEDKISYAQANALLFDAMHYSKAHAEVSLSIVRALQAHKQGRNISWEEAERLIEKQSLDSYLFLY